MLNSRDDENKSLMIQLGGSLNGNAYDFKTQSYREAHKQMRRLAEKSMDEESSRHEKKLTNTLRLSLVGVLSLVVTITVLIITIAIVNIHINNSATEIERLRIESGVYGDEGGKER